MDLKNDYRAFKRAYHYFKAIKGNKEYLDWFYEERSKLFQFRNKHAGEDCFIIGNGPSLNKMDLSLLNDYYTFGMNKIFLIFKRVKLDLDYLVAVNPFVIEQSIDFYSNCSDSFKIFLSSRGAKKYDTQNNNIYYLNSGGKLDNPGKVLSYIWEGYTVTFVTIQLAYFMGFKNIYLVGVDHNFSQKGKPNEVQEMDNDDINHFDPSYFKGNKWQLADLEGAELGYNTAKKFFVTDNRQIIDATVDGKLEIFPKINYQDALKKAKKRKE